MKILVVKELNRLKPCYDSDIEAFKKMPNGESFEIEYKRKRNYKFHKKFFALIKLFFDNQDVYNNIDEARNDLTIEAGYYTTSTNMFTGEENKVSKSISFASMSEDEFEKLYSDVLDVICRVMHIESKQVEDNLIGFM